MADCKTDKETTIKLIQRCNFFRRKLKVKIGGGDRVAGEGEESDRPTLILQVEHAELDSPCERCLKTKSTFILNQVSLSIFV